MLSLLFKYLLIINIIAFLYYGFDKRKAIKGKWRIPEQTLLTFALLGGFVGSMIGMKVFHHKTNKIGFWIVNILCMLFYIAFVIYTIK